MDHMVKIDEPHAGNNNEQADNQRRRIESHCRAGAHRLRRDHAETQQDDSWNAENSDQHPDHVYVHRICANEIQDTGDRDEQHAGGQSDWSAHEVKGGNEVKGRIELF